MNPAGAALRLFARTLARLWFHHVERRGEPLPPGPVLLVLNHPNGLLDPLLAVALLERPPRFVAKAALWKAIPLRPLLAFFRAIPVQRTQDAGMNDAERKAALAATFSAVFATFAKGDVLGIFPEGISHAGHDLAPLKTGPARMLLGAPVRPALVPAGLVYGDRGVFRHSALLRLGAPIDTSGLEGTDPETVLTLTAKIRAALYPLTLHGSDDEATRLAQDLAWLLAEGPRPWADLGAFHARAQALLAWLSALPEPDRRRVEEEVANARAWLAEGGLRPDQVGQPYPVGETLRWLPKPSPGCFSPSFACRRGSCTGRPTAWWTPWRGTGTRISTWLPPASCWPAPCCCRCGRLRCWSSAGACSARPAPGPGPRRFRRRC